jgi:hypothetical protein
VLVDLNSLLFLCGSDSCKSNEDQVEESEIFWVELGEHFESIDSRHFQEPGPSNRITPKLKKLIASTVSTPKINEHLEIFEE